MRLVKPGRVNNPPRSLSVSNPAAPVNGQAWFVTKRMLGYTRFVPPVRLLPTPASEKTMPPRLTPIAIVYDFDGTLAPGNMQEHAFIPDIGMKPSDFWDEVGQLMKENQADGVLMYMHLMLKKAASAGVPVRRDDFSERARDIKLFEGVTDWFGRINGYGKSRRVRVRHYIVSSGNSEIIEGTPIASNFERIYASKFLFDPNGVPIWPALAVNFTNKTQYLFRINKGAHDLSDDRQINEFVDKGKRPIPFENMVYIGDGSTDVPCFRLVKEQGGLSIAVFKPHTPGAQKSADAFRRDGRVQRVAPAIYTEGSELDTTVKTRIDLIAATREHSRALARG